MNAKERMRIAVLASGSGSNLQAILDASAANALDADVVAVFSDNPQAFALQRARQAAVPTIVCVPRPGKGHDRRAWDAGLASVVALAQPDWIVLAGFMRLLSSSFLDRFPGRVLNLHPARPGELPGMHAIERAHTEFLAGKRTVTGVMIHLVPDEGVDSGPVLSSVEVPIDHGDSLQALGQRMHLAEHALLVGTLQQLADRHRGSTPQNVSVQSNAETSNAETAETTAIPSSSFPDTGAFSHA
jgi:phosphoribosylglycinamide formyltransferase 1